MMRILHVVSIMNRAGQESLIMNLYRNIDRTKIQFDFLCTSSEKGDFDEEIESLGGTIHHLTPSKIKIPHLYVLGVIYNLRNFFNAHSEYEIVHFHNYHAYSVLVQVLGAKLGKVKHIIVHSHNTNAPHQFIHKLSKPFLKFFKLHRFACSKAAGKWMFGKTANNFEVIKNGICPEQFTYNQVERERLRRELGIKDKKILLHIGRFSYQKNHKYLIQILENLVRLDPSTHLLLVGRGELEYEIKEDIERRKLNRHVSFLGIRTDVASLLSASDLFIFPSLFEGLSVVLVETQASGIKILTTTNLAAETIFADQVTQLSTDLNPEVWARKALNMLTEYERKKMDEDVKKAGFDIKHISERLSSFYLNLD